MRTIYKFKLETTDKQGIRASMRAKPLCVQVQNGEPCLWMLVDTDYDNRDYEVFVKGTGHPITPEEASLQYIGSYQLNNGALVFHVFMEA